MLAFGGNVISLHEADRPHPLSKEMAVSSLKRYIANNSTIQLVDLVIGEANRLYKEYSLEEYSLHFPFSHKVYERRVQSFEASIGMLLNMIIAGCRWGKKEHGIIWAKCIERVNIPWHEEGQIDEWFKLKFYPSIILLYAAGISSLRGENHDNFAAIFELPKCYDHDGETPLITQLAISNIFPKNIAQRIFDKKNFRNPASEHLQEILRIPFYDYMPGQVEYVRIFDKFEYLYSLIYADFFEKANGEIWGPIGCFFWRDRSYKSHIINIIESESSGEKDSWAPLRAGLFDGSFKRFEEIRIEYNKFLRKIPWY